MKYCSKCGKEVHDEAIICPQCGCAIAPLPPVTQQRPEADEASVGLCILAFFVPLFGLIYWAVKCKDTPKRANAIGITALISWIIGFVTNLVAIGVVFLPLFLTALIVA